MRTMRGVSRGAWEEGKEQLSVRPSACTRSGEGSSPARRCTPPWSSTGKRGSSSRSHQVIWWLRLCLEWWEIAKVAVSLADTHHQFLRHPAIRSAGVAEWRVRYDWNRFISPVPFVCAPG